MGAYCTHAVSTAHPVCIRSVAGALPGVCVECAARPACIQRVSALYPVCIQSYLCPIVCPGCAQGVHRLRLQPAHVALWVYPARIQRVDFAGYSRRAQRAPRLRPGVCPMRSHGVLGTDCARFVLATRWGVSVAARIHRVSIMYPRCTQVPQAVFARSSYPLCIQFVSRVHPSRFRRARRTRARYVYNAYPHCIHCVSIMYPWCIHDAPRVSLAPSQVSRGVINSRPLYPWCIRDVSIVYPALVQRTAFPCVRVMRAAQSIVYPPCIHVVSTLYPPARRPRCVQGVPKVYPVHFTARALGSLPPDQRARNVVFLLGRSDAPSVGVSLGCASGCGQDVLRTPPSVALSLCRPFALVVLAARWESGSPRVSIVYPVCIQVVPRRPRPSSAPSAYPSGTPCVSSVYPSCF
jgi:hypothetical protein